MSISLKKEMDTDLHLLRSSFSRVQEDPRRELSNDQIESLISAFIQTGTLEELPMELPGEPISSIHKNKYLRDQAFNLEITGRQIDELKDTIEVSCNETKALFSNLEREVASYRASIKEVFDKIESNSSFVWINQWNRSSDDHDYGANLDLLRDQKTLFSLRNRVNEHIPSLGLTLPIREILPVTPTSVHLVGELTDVGDTQHPLRTDPPMNLLKGKRFRHTIIRKEYDTTTKKYRFDSSTMALLFSFSHAREVNTIVIESDSMFDLKVKEINYYDINNEKQSLTTDKIDVTLKKKLLIPSILCRGIEIIFETSSVVGRNKYLEEEDRTNRLQAIRSRLENIGFKNLPEKIENSIQGRIYDFAIRKVEFGRASYLSSGVFCSKTFDVSNFVSAQLTSLVGNSNHASGHYGTSFEDNLVEMYFYLLLKDEDGSTLVNHIVPIPDTSKEETEALVIVAQKAKVNFYPDINEPIEVYSNGVLMTPFVDYDVSYDNGSTWFTSPPTITQLQDIDPIAGNLSFRFNNLDLSKEYTCKYTRRKKQTLVPGFLKLDSNTILWNSNVRQTTGEFRILCNLRASGSADDVTPILKEFKLRVNEL